MFGAVKKRIMYISVQIPYQPNRKIAVAYNRALKTSVSDWVLFLDHDVFLCNPYWYEMCIKAIENVKDDPRAALITCYAGGERMKRTLKESGEPVDSITGHIALAEHYYKKHGNDLEEVKEPVAGFFMLLNRKIAREIKFVQGDQSINNVDKMFCKKLLSKGYHIYRMSGLYIYHRRGMKHLKWKQK